MDPAAVVAAEAWEPVICVGEFRTGLDEDGNEVANSGYGNKAEWAGWLGTYALMRPTPSGSVIAYTPVYACGFDGARGLGRRESTTTGTIMYGQDGVRSAAAEAFRLLASIARERRCCGEGGEGGGEANRSPARLPKSMRRHVSPLSTILGEEADLGVARGIASKETVSGELFITNSSIDQAKAFAVAGKALRGDSDPVGDRKAAAKAAAERKAESKASARLVVGKSSSSKSKASGRLAGASEASAGVAGAIVSRDESSSDDPEEAMPIRLRIARRLAATATASGAAASSSFTAPPPASSSSTAPRPASSSSTAPPPASQAAADSGLQEAMARAVLAASALGDHERVLSALGVSVSYDSNAATKRKAYLGLARLIHPDKLGNAFAGAAKAFPALVTAFEALSSPGSRAGDGAGAGGKGKAKQAAPRLARSNHNCWRTRVLCPRCSCQWGTDDSGLRPYEYNFMMQGLKTYVCSCCLNEFGCMSAIHQCPYCSAEIDYHPDQYNTQVLCGGCDNAFGFKLYQTGSFLRVHRTLGTRSWLSLRMCSDRRSASLRTCSDHAPLLGSRA